MLVKCSSHLPSETRALPIFEDLDVDLFSDEAPIVFEQLFVQAPLKILEVRVLASIWLSPLKRTN